MAANLVIRHLDWSGFDPRHPVARVEMEPAAIDPDAVYVLQAEHSGTLYQFFGCRPERAAGGKVVFDLGNASLVLSGPAGWTGNPLWPPDRDDQPGPN